MNLSQRQHKTIQIAVVGAITLLFILFVVLAFLIAVRLNHRRQEQQLLATRAQILYLMNQAEHDMDFFLSSRFAEEFALKYHNWGFPGQSTWTQ